MHAYHLGGLGAKLIAQGCLIRRTKKRNPDYSTRKQFILIFCKSPKARAGGEIESLYSSLIFIIWLQSSSSLFYPYPLKRPGFSCYFNREQLLSGLIKFSPPDRVLFRKIYRQQAYLCPNKPIVISLSPPVCS